MTDIIYLCPRCKQSQLLWEQFQGMMLIRKENGVTYHRVRCEKCGDFEIDHFRVKSLKKANEKK